MLSRFCNGLLLVSHYVVDTVSTAWYGHLVLPSAMCRFASEGQQLTLANIEIYSMFWQLMIRPSDAMPYQLSYEARQKLLLFQAQGHCLIHLSTVCWANQKFCLDSYRLSRASHRYSRRSRVGILLKPWFFQGASFQLLKLENLLRWSFFTFRDLRCPTSPYGWLGSNCWVVLGCRNRF